MCVCEYILSYDPKRSVAFSLFWGHIASFPKIYCLPYCILAPPLRAEEN